MAKGTSERDIHITNLVKNFKMAIVDERDIPTETHIDDVDNGPVLLETVGRQIVKKTNYFSFVLGKQQFTAPATVVEALRRVNVEYVDNTNNLVVRGVHVVSDYPYLVDADALNDEMYHWGHQVYMVKQTEHADYNMLIHVSRYSEDGKWEVRNYLAKVAM